MFGDATSLEHVLIYFNDLESLDHEEYGKECPDDVESCRWEKADFRF